MHYRVVYLGVLFFFPCEGDFNIKFSCCCCTADFQTFIDKFQIEAAVKYSPTTRAPSRYCTCLKPLVVVWSERNCLRNSNLTIYGIFPVFCLFPILFALSFHYYSVAPRGRGVRQSWFTPGFSSLASTLSFHLSLNMQSFPSSLVCA